MTRVAPCATCQARIGRWSFRVLPYDTWQPRGKIGFRSDGPRWLDFDRTAHVDFGSKFPEGSIATWHILSRHMPRVNHWLVRTIYEAYSACHVAKMTRVITWLVHVSPSAACQALIGPYNFDAFKSWHVAATWQILIGQSTLIELLIGRPRGL